MLERLVDQAALELGIDPIEIRRRNFLADDAFPFQTIAGPIYDTGRYLLPLERAAEVVGYEELRIEQARRRAAGDDILLGIGVAAYVEVTSGSGRHGVRCGRGQRRRRRHDVRRHAVARPGPPDRLRDARLRSDRHPGRSHHARRRRHRPHPHRWRHRRVALAAARRLGRPRCNRSDGRCRQAARGTHARSRRRTTSSSTPRRARIGVAGVPAQAIGWAELAARAAAEGDPLRRRVRLRTGRRHVPVRRPHRRGRGRCGDRRGAAGPPRGCRRLRHGAQPVARRRSAARRHRGRCRPGAVRGGPVRETATR